jgi:hypothetical protein
MARRIALLALGWTALAPAALALPDGETPTYTARPELVDALADRVLASALKGCPPQSPPTPVSATVTETSLEISCDAGPGRRERAAFAISDPYGSVQARAADGGGRYVLVDQAVYEANVVAGYPAAAAAGFAEIDPRLVVARAREKARAGAPDARPDPLTRGLALAASAIDAWLKTPALDWDRAIKP